MHVKFFFLPETIFHTLLVLGNSVMKFDSALCVAAASQLGENFYLYVSQQALHIGYEGG